MNLKSASFLLVLLFQSTFVSFAQRVVAELEMKNGKAQHIFSTTDSFGDLVYIFQGSKSIQVTILNSKLEVTKEFLIPEEETDKRNELIGVSLNASTVIVYLYDSKEKKFASLRIDKSTGVYTFLPQIGQLQKNDQFLKAFDMEGIFYVLAIPQYKNEVRMLSSLSGEAFLSKTYVVNFPTLYAKLSSNNDELNQNPISLVGIEQINYTIENNVKSTYSSKKLYTYGNQVYMTFEDPGHTHLVIIDPNDNQAIYRKLNFTLDRSKSSTPRQGNSFLYKGDLFRVTYNNDQLNLLVVTLDSMQLLKSYNIFPEEPITFINGVIREDGGGREDKVVKNTQAFFKRLAKGKIAVAVNELNDRTYNVELGSYEEATVYRNSGAYPMSPGLSIGIGTGMGMGGFGMGGMGMGMGGMGMGMGGMGMGGYPGYYPYGSNYGSSSTSIHITYFQSLLAIEDLVHQPGNVPKTIREKINDYEKDVFKNASPELLNVAPISKGLLFGYYLKGRSRYNLVEFTR